MAYTSRWQQLRSNSKSKGRSSGILQRSNQQDTARRQPQSVKQIVKRPSDDYLLNSQEDNDLYTARMQYLREKRNNQSRSILRPPPVLRNSANSTGGSSGGSNGPPRHSQSRTSKVIMSYHQNEEAPTKDLKILVLLLVRSQIREEVLHLSEVVNEQNPFEMRNMRMNSFIANTFDVIDHWKVAMLEESMRIIDESFDADDIDWVDQESGKKSSIPMPMDEQMLVSLPADKPEISKSQVATAYIQAQRGYQANEQDDAIQLFQSDMLLAEKAAETSPEMFERICNCYKSLLQKAVEIEYIEKKPETCSAIDSLTETLKYSVDRVIQEALTQNLVDAGENGSAFLRVLVGDIMKELHAKHEERLFESMLVRISGQKQD